MLERTDKHLTKVKMYSTPGKTCPHFPASPKLSSPRDSVKIILLKRKDKEIIVGDKRLLKFKVSRRGSQLPDEPHSESLQLKSKTKASTQPGFFYKQHCDPLSMLILEKKTQTLQQQEAQIPNRKGISIKQREF